MSSHDPKDVEQWEKLIAAAAERGVKGLITEQSGDDGTDPIMARREHILAQVLTDMGVQPDENLEPDLDEDRMEAVRVELMRRAPLTESEKELVFMAHCKRDIVKALD